MAFERVADVSRLDEGVPMLVDIRGLRLCVVRRGGDVFAIQDDCPHEGGPMSEGKVDGHEIECPWHVARFDLRDGRLLFGPAYAGVVTYPARISGEAVEIDLPA